MKAARVSASASRAQTPVTGRTPAAADFGARLPTAPGNSLNSAGMLYDRPAFVISDRPDRVFTRPRELISCVFCAAGVKLRPEAGHRASVGPWVKICLAIAALVTALALLVPAYIWLASEAIIQRRYPLASTTAHAEMTAKQLRRGAHLVAIAGCADCHGPNLEGRRLDARSPLPVWAGSLRRSAGTMSDSELERAIRYGIRPDATTLWRMPSACYTYMSEDDVGSIVSYLRSLPPHGEVRPQPHFDLAARSALLQGQIRPSILVAADSPSSLDLGPRYDGGRYLARISCGECHGTDLKGEGYAPDLARIALYDRPAFFALLREGRGARGRYLPVMHRLAGIAFHAFADYEIMALYDYLDARAHAPPQLVARADALRRHQESEKLLNDSGQ